VNGEIALHFEPYSSRVIVFSSARSSSSPRSMRSIVASRELRSGWASTIEGQSKSPIELPHSWAQDERTRYFSGTATYTHRFEVDPPFRAAGVRVLLDFGDAAPIDREPLPGGTLRGNSFAALVAPPIREAATVFVNGRRAGVLWAPPFRIDITDLLGPGTNELRLDVYNTAINALARGGGLPDLKAVVGRYGQRFRLQDLDRLEPLPSGILAVPRLLAER
jgi:hypothetical protein